ncbi:heparan-alpha-glucosaminide N-acetyltransferase domain-containing protein [Micrococcus luteus]
MTSVSSPVPGRPGSPVAAWRPVRGDRRVRGVDAARGAAVLGMVAVHVGHASSPDGTPSWEYLAFAGLASAAFVVAAGVSLALSWPGPGSAGSHGGTTTATHHQRTARLLLRAALLFVLGLLLGLLESPVAVILCHYGLLFSLAPPLLRLGTRAALAAGLAWTVLGPVAVFAATVLGWAVVGRSDLSVDGRLWTSPVPADLLRPHVLGLDLLLTGYYPLLSWGGFLVLGIGLGRALEAARDGGDAGENGAAPVMRRTALRMLLGGAAAWAVGASLWLLLPRSTAVLERITAATGLPPETLRSSLLTGEHTLVWLIPDPLWLALAVPHGGGVGEALRAAGAATAVLGLCVLLADRMPPLRPSLTAPLEAVGRIPLTLYTGHLAVLALLADAGLHSSTGRVGRSGWDWDGTTAVLLAWAGCLIVALAFWLLRSRGPLEAGLQAAVGAVVGKREAALR